MKMVKLLRKYIPFLFALFVLGFFLTPYVLSFNAKNGNLIPYIPQSAQSSWSWSELELISDTSTGHSDDPAIAIDSEERIHVVWDDITNMLGSDVDRDIFYRFYDPATETWSTIELVSSESTVHCGDALIAIDVEDTVHVAWRDPTDYLSEGSDFDVFYKKKTSGGIWSTAEVISTDSTTDIDTTFDIAADDEVFITWVDTTGILGSGPDKDVFLRVYDGSWSSTRLLTPESNDTSSYPAIGVDSNSGDIHLTWRDETEFPGSGADEDVFYRTWNKNTESLSSLEIVSSFEEEAFSSGGDICVDTFGDVHVVWGDHALDNETGLWGDLFYRKKDISTSTWGTIEFISPESIDGPGIPKMTVDAQGYVSVVWHDTTDYLDPDPTNYDIFYKFRDPATNLWTAAQVLSTESDDNSLLTDIAVDSKGFISCVWMDMDDVHSSGIDEDIFYKRLAGVPTKPILNPILPDPSKKGPIILEWGDIICAEEYLVYRDTSNIISVSGLTPIVKVTEPTFTDILTEKGIYYYVIYAQNEFGLSAQSNIQQVEISSGLFLSFNLTELLVLGGSVLGLLIVVPIVTFVLGKKAK